MTPERFMRSGFQRLLWIRHGFPRAAGVMLAAAALALPAVAQGPVRPPAFDTTGVGDTSMFAPLNLTAPNLYRTGSGAPGPRYWQNRADYDLEATLDTAKTTLSGKLRLRYTNNSPDTLRFIWMQMEQNAFKDKSLNSFIFPQESRFGARGFEGGDFVEHFDQISTRAAAPSKTALKTRVEGTMMKVDLAEPLAPGKVATFQVAWHFLIPNTALTGWAATARSYELAQWYPRVAVYDDVAAGTLNPTSARVSSLEYGDFNYAVTVPAGYRRRRRADEPRRGAHREPDRASRQAAKSDSTVQSSRPPSSGRRRRPKPARATAGQKAHSRGVPRRTSDVAWGASGVHQDASAGRGRWRTRSTARAPSRRGRTRPTCRACRSWSTRALAQYPYPQITAIEGRSAAWSTWSRWRTRAGDLYNVVTHEIGHKWFR
jgi:hypothetical protein